jgi:hypothetical protein
MIIFNGDTNCISNIVDDGVGNVSFNIDVNGDAFGSTHNGTVTCSGAVTIANAIHRDGGGHYDGYTNGNIYIWHTQCGNFAGVHYTIELVYAVTASADATLRDVAAKMTKHGVAQAAVLRGKDVVGAISAKDIVAYVAKSGASLAAADAMATPVSEIMRKKPVD